MAMQMRNLKQKFDESLDLLYFVVLTKISFKFYLVFVASV